MKKTKFGLQDIPLKYIVADKDKNPRKKEDNGAFEDLKNSIEQKGIIVPVIVRPVNNHFELVCGFRRFRAASQLKLQYVPAIVKELDEKQAAEVRTIENLQREDLNILDEAEGFKKLLTDFGWRVEDVAEKVGKSEVYIHKRISLLNAPDFIQKAVAENQIALGHAMILKGIQDRGEQKQYLEWAERSRWSVKQLLKTLSDRERKIDKDTPFDTSGCKGCKWFGPNQKELPLDDLGKARPGNICFNKSCYEKKSQDAVDQLMKDAKKAGLPVEKIDSWGWNWRWKELTKSNRKDLVDPEKCKKCPQHVIIMQPKHGGGYDLKDTCKKSSCKNWKDSLKQSKENKKEREEKKKEKENLDALAEWVIAKIDPYFMILEILVRELDSTYSIQELKSVTRQFIKRFGFEETLLNQKKVYDLQKQIIGIIKKEDPKNYPEMLKVVLVMGLRVNSPESLVKLANQIKQSQTKLKKKVKKEMVKKGKESKGNKKGKKKGKGKKR